MAENKNSFDSIIPHILRIEGKIGEHSAYGIDVKAFPKEFETAKTITQVQGEGAAINYANAFYKREFWDKKGMDSIPSETRDIVFDATINHSTKFSDYVTAAAKQGASRDNLLEMRKAEYERLARVNPDKYGQYLKGWKNRLNTFKGGAQLTASDEAEIAAARPPAAEDKEEQASLITDIMKENPTLGLFLVIIGIIASMLNSDETEGLMRLFSGLPKNKREEATQALSPGHKRIYNQHKVNSPDANSTAPDTQKLHADNEAAISRLHPAFRDKARTLVANLEKADVPVAVTQDFRSDAEQDALYSRGRTATGAVVTNAKAGTSYHNYGAAFDVTPLAVWGKPDLDPANPVWDVVGREAKNLGLTWGGDFNSIVDKPHIQLSGISIASLRGLKDKGLVDPDGYVLLHNATMNVADAHHVSSLLPTPRNAGTAVLTGSRVSVLGHA